MEEKHQLASSNPLTPEEIANHRRLLAFEMKQHPAFFGLMGQMTGISPEAALDDIARQLSGQPPSKPPKR